MYAKAAEDRYLQVVFRDAGGTNGAYATFDVQAGVISGPLTAIGAGVPGSAAIQAVGGGVYRCSIATTVGPSTSANLLLLLSNTPTPAFAPSYAGNASNGLLIWGAQFEQGAAATSYIPSGGSGGTRATDSCYIPTAAWFSASAYSLFAECIGGANVNSMIGGVGDTNCS